MQHDEDPRARPVDLGVGLDLGGVQDERLGLVPVELLLGRADEHRLREERVVRARRDDAHADAMGGVGTGEGVDHVEARLRREVVDDLLAEPVELRLLDRGVGVAPPDALLGARLAHDELVLRRPAGEPPGVDDERAALGQPAVTALERVRVELRRGRVVEDLSLRLDPVLFQAHPGRRRAHLVRGLLDRASPGGRRDTCTGKP